MRYKPGLYEVLSTDEAYIDMLKLDADGIAKQVGERFLDDGVVERVYIVEDADAPRRNPSKSYDEILRLYKISPPIRDLYKAAPDSIILEPEEVEDLDWRLVRLPVKVLKNAINFAKERAKFRKLYPEDDAERLDAIRHWLRSGGSLEDSPGLVILEGGSVNLVDGWHRLQVASDQGYKNIQMAVALGDQGVNNPRRNPAIRIGAGFFSNALRDYSEWRLKWWRECIQNSVDAGSTEIELEAEEMPNGNWLVRCTDNGGGMSRSVLFDKFLVLGESGKSERSGMIGGFGKAKELLVLPWIQWHIVTGSIEVIGSGIDYEVHDVDPIDGTVIEVIMPPDQHTTIDAAMEYLQRCSIRGVRFYLNDELFDEKLRTGSYVKSLSYGEMYRNKSKLYGEAYVRANGMYMFTAGSFDSQYGTLVIELTGDTTKLLTANRDGFRSWQQSWEITNFVNELVTEGERALKAKQGLTTDIWKGTHKISTEQGMTSILDALGPLPPVAPGGDLVVSNEATESVIAELNIIWTMTSTESSMLNIGPASHDVAQEIIHEPIRGASDAEALAKALVWQPDFMVRNEIEWFNVPSKFKPAKMGAKIAALAKVWAEACRWVFIQLNKHAEYGVGFVFSDDALAMHKIDEERNNWLLLNPVRGGGRPGALLSKGKRDDLKEIYASAIHEVTHMANGFSAHDSAFAAALTHNFAVCSDGFQTMVRIAKDIKVVGTKPKKKPKKPKKETKKKIPVIIHESLDGEELFIHPRGREEEQAIQELGAKRVYRSTGQTPYWGIWNVALNRQAAFDFINKYLDLNQYELDELEGKHDVYTEAPLTVVTDLLTLRNGYLTDRAVDVHVWSEGNKLFLSMDPAGDPYAIMLRQKMEQEGGLPLGSKQRFTYSVGRYGRAAEKIQDYTGGDVGYVDLDVSGPFPASVFYQLWNDYGRWGLS